MRIVGLSQLSQYGSDVGSYGIARSFLIALSGFDLNQALDLFSSAKIKGLRSSVGHRIMELILGGDVTQRETKSCIELQLARRVRLPNEIYPVGTAQTCAGIDYLGIRFH